MTTTLLQLLLSLLIILLSARGLGLLLEKLGQPPVMGEVLAGIVLGPSVLGRLSPELSHLLLPQAVLPLLNVLAQVGVIFYMFIVGLELNPAPLLQRTRSVVAISQVGMIVPLLLGTGLAFFLPREIMGEGTSFLVFALFVGISMCVTAFPVLARVLHDRGMTGTTIGTLALASAAVDDAAAWCLLAFAVSVARTQPSDVLRTLVLAACYVAFMFWVVRPALVRWTTRQKARGQVMRGELYLAFMALLLSSLVTELIGLHSLLGAFLLGALIPNDSLFARELRHRIEDVALMLLLPAFFAVTGMRTQIGLVSGPMQWALCGVLILVASLGKFGGCTLAARASGLDWRTSSTVGVLMNTRGLMELVVLNVALELHIFSPTLFAMLVLMALVTTFATTPGVQLIQRDPRFPLFRRKVAAVPSHGAVAPSALAGRGLGPARADTTRSSRA